MRSMSIITCPKCGEWFRLTFDDNQTSRSEDNPKQLKHSDGVPGLIQPRDHLGSATLRIRSCPSGGVYDVSIYCPYCGHSDDL